MENNTPEQNIYTFAALDILAKARIYSKWPPGRAGGLTILGNGAFIETRPYMEDFQAAAQKIFGTQKYAYDDSTLEAVERTSSLDTEEILGNLDKISFPFDRMSIVGRSAANPKMLSYFVVETDSEKHSFTFRTFYYHSEVETNNRTFIAVLGESLVTVDKNGFHFDEDELLRELEKKREIIRKNSGGIIEEDALSAVEERIIAEIDSIQQSADFLARLFVVMGATKGSLPRADSKLLDEEVKLNRRRQKDKFPAKLLTGFMEIDLSLPGYENKTPTQKQARALLGWTSVRRSNPIISKYGKEFTRKPHDRRIATQIDLRGRDRSLTVRNPEVALAVAADRPVFVPPRLPVKTSENDQ